MVTKQTNLMHNKIQKSYNLLYFFSFLSNLKKTAIIIFKQASACNVQNTDIFFQKTVVKSYPTYFLKKNSYKTQYLFETYVELLFFWIFLQDNTILNSYQFAINFSFFVIASLTADLDFIFILMIFCRMNPNVFWWSGLKKSILAQHSQRIL